MEGVRRRRRYHCQCLCLFQGVRRGEDDLQPVLNAISYERSMSANLVNHR